MALMQTGFVSAALSVSGTAQGYITLTSTTGFAVGAICYLNQTGAADAVEVVVTEIAASNKLGLRRTDQRYNTGRSDMSSWTTVNAASITQPSQTIVGSRVLATSAFE